MRRVERASVDVKPPTPGDVLIDRLTPAQTVERVVGVGLGRYDVAGALAEFVLVGLSALAHKASAVSWRVAVRGDVMPAPPAPG
jgi:hypothetical protein